MKNRSFDIVGKRKIWFTISITLMVITLLASIVLGVKLDIQFSGGTLVNYAFSGEIDKTEFETTIEDALGQTVSVQEQRDVATGLANYVVTHSSKTGISPDQQIAVNSALDAKYAANNLQVVNMSNVDPSIGRDFFIKSIVAVIAALILMIVYIAFRFRKMSGWSAGAISVLALLHDVIISYAVFVICGFPLNDNFIAVVLTILGYSINNTIIIYDRIRENRRLMPARTSYHDLVNASINQSMGRSVNTTVATVLAVLCVCILAIIYNVSSILTFALPLLVGMFAGFFSSVFISGPLWAYWQEKHHAQKKAA